MEQQVARRILQQYGVQSTAILSVQKGYRNRSYGVHTTKGMLNLIIYKHEPGMAQRITRIHAIGAFLEGQGMPVRAPRDPRLLQLKTPAGIVYAGIYNYLPGNTIPWEAYTMAHIKVLGAAMGNMHAKLMGYDPTNLPSVSDESLALNKRMVRYFADLHVAGALRQKLGLAVKNADFTKILRLAKKFPNQQALHMDFVRGNILFNANAHITGIIDFEKTAVGHPLFDIARTLAFLLVDCKFKNEQKVRKYFLQSGYIKRGTARLQTIKINQTDVLETLVDFYLLHDFYKFLRHNPYEFLPQNEHFTRTKTMLLKRRLIAKTSVE